MFVVTSFHTTFFTTAVVVALVVVLVVAIVLAVVLVPGLFQAQGLKVRLQVSQGGRSALTDGMVLHDGVDVDLLGWMHIGRSSSTSVMGVGMVQHTAGDYAIGLLLLLLLCNHHVVVLCGSRGGVGIVKRWWHRVGVIRLAALRGSYRVGSTSLLLFVHGIVFRSLLLLLHLFLHVVVRRGSVLCLHHGGVAMCC